jgi:hypothetical protein
MRGRSRRAVRPGPGTVAGSGAEHRARRCGDLPSSLAQAALLARWRLPGAPWSTAPGGAVRAQAVRCSASDASSGDHCFAKGRI